MKPPTKLTDGQTTLHIDRYVLGQLHTLSNKLAAGASSCYRRSFGIGIAEWRVLAMLAIENGISANRICQTMGLDKGVVSRALKSLEEQHYVQSVVDPGDARRNIVHLTREGSQLHDKILKAATAREQLLLGDFSDEEIETLLSLLKRLRDRVGTVNAYTPTPENPAE